MKVPNRNEDASRDADRGKPRTVMPRGQIHKPPKSRIDKLLVERGLAETRTQAQAMILAGQVLAAEQRIDKPGQMIDRAAEIRIKGESTRYASRGGVKLEAALH